MASSLTAAAAIAESSAAASSSYVSSPPGRVVRLHFACRAELPMGSSLRVTGSSLWAPTHLTAQDPTNAHHISVQQSQNALTTYSLDPNVVMSESAAGDGGTDEGASVNYTSSVQMVTSPDTYPLWKTRRPVIVVLHKQGTVVQHHYYRYMVVTPGASWTSGGTTGTTGAPPEDDSMWQDDASQDSSASNQDLAPPGGPPAPGAEIPGVSTSNEILGSSPVMMWEDPFPPSVTPAKSTASMASVTSGTMISSNKRRTHLANLPYRTLNIDVQTATVVLEPDGITTTDQGHDDTDDDNTDEDQQPVLIDNWNGRDDVSFRPYLIREAIHSENRKLNFSRALMEELDPSEHGGRTPPSFPQQQRIFFVCYHLPVVVVQSPTSGVWRASWSESLLAKTEGSKVVQNYNAHWVGTVTTRPPITNDTDKQAVMTLLKEMNCTPLFLDASLSHQHYYGFCKQVLWPAFHNIDLLDLHIDATFTEGEHHTPWDQSRLDHWWEAYQQVNQAFCQTMSSMVKLNDIVWIHDYHLSLLPQYMHQDELTKSGGRSWSRKVFFLHIPFPTSQIFRELECGEAILQGMLHADVVGFHAFDHARHFLNAAKRILGLDYESLVGGLIGVHFHGKTVLVTMSNVSIEPKMVDAALMLPTVQVGTNQLQSRHGDRTIIAGVDIGQRLSGVSLKLLAFERLLKDYPPWQNRVVMVQRVLLPGSRKADETNTVRELRYLVKRIQDTFGDEVVDYQEMTGSSLPMDQRLALWRAADVLMVTPIREGLNHWPMEYIYARKEPERPGIVIASEFSAVCSILNGALRVNPFDIQMTITTIDKALSMGMEEREGRRYRDIDFVSKSPSEKWTRNVLRDLRDAIVRQPVGESQTSTAASTPGATPMHGRKELIDSTAAYLARESGLAFTHCDAHSVKKAFDATTRRVLILDFNGTIVIKEPPGKYLKREILGTSGNKPPPEVMEALTILCKDPMNTVYVVSGDSSENVMNAVGHIPGLGLAASNGGHFSPPSPPGQTERKWQTFDLGVDWDAVKRVALPVLSKYTARSNGSFVKLTHFSIGWSYYSCDPEWGSLQASHVVLELESELRAFDVRFVTLKGVVEIVPRQLNKGLLVKKVLRDTAYQHEEGIDFILCMGDDISDEKMFTSVFAFVAEMGDDQNQILTPPVVSDGSDDVQMEVDNALPGPVNVKDPLYCYTVAVGKKPSHASHWVHDAQEVANILVGLTSGEMPQRGTPTWGQSNSTNIFA